MNVPFDAQQELVIVRATVEGSAGTGILRLALDPGATGTLINVGMLVVLGYGSGAGVRTYPGDNWE